MCQPTPWDRRPPSFPLICTSGFHGYLVLPSMHVTALTPRIRSIYPTGIRQSGLVFTATADIIFIFMSNHGSGPSIFGVGYGATCIYVVGCVRIVRVHLSRTVCLRVKVLLILMWKLHSFSCWKNTNIHSYMETYVRRKSTRRQECIHRLWYTITDWKVWERTTCREEVFWEFVDGI